MATHACRRSATIVAAPRLFTQTGSVASYNRAICGVPYQRAICGVPYKRAIIGVPYKRAICDVPYRRDHLWQLPPHGPSVAAPATRAICGSSCYTGHLWQLLPHEWRQALLEQLLIQNEFNRRNTNKNN